ncbi:MAG TPA: cell division protein FtsA, partial [Candidatus Berkiella sp.]|nr:cell division protein FtsA [Candidatus Berkiella sp.]
GVVELAEDIFRMPVRLGLPRYITGLVDVQRNPIYSTGIGLLLYGRQQQLERHLDVTGQRLSGIWGKVKRWFQGNF